MQHSANVEIGVVQSFEFQMERNLENRSYSADFEECLALACKNRPRYSREQAPTSLLYDEGSRALIWDRFCP